MAEPYIIDAWMQHPTERFMNQPWLDSLKRWLGSEDQFAQLPIDFTLSAMDAGQVKLGLLCAWYGPRGDLVTNDEVAAWVKAHPGRFKGIASADITRPMEAVRELRRAVTEHGFVGLRMLPWLWNLPPNDRRFYPLYAECCELGIPFCTQIGHTGPLCPSEPGRPIPYLEEVLLEFPDLVVVGGHVGFPWMNEVMTLARKFPNFYIDTSAYKLSRLPEELVTFMKGRGRNRVLFGTNHPMILASMTLEGLDGLGLDDETKALFLHDNAKRVFDLSD